MSLLKTFGRARAGGVRIRHLLPVVGMVAIAAAFVVMPGSRGATTCQIVSGLPIIQVNTDGAGDVTIARDTSGLFGAAIRVNGVSCGTVTTVDKIIVQATGGSQRLFIDTANGPFGPGKTRESTGTSEIEFEVNLGDAEDLVQVLGGSAADKYNVGTAGWNTNVDNDGDDIKVLNVEGQAADGRAGDDIITGQGGAGAGTATTSSFNITGAAGNDNLTGGNANDVLKPGLGNDTVAGGAGTNTVDYTEVTAAIKIDFRNGTSTGSGSDTLTGVQNANTGPGDDEIWEPEAAQRNVFHLGAGNDTYHSNGLRPSQDAPLNNLSDQVFLEAGNDWSFYDRMPHNSPGAIINLPLNTVSGSPEHDDNDGENFVATGGDDVIIDEDGQRNDIRGGDGNDRFEAGVKKPTNDAPDANGHSDNFDGEAGIDTASYAATEHNSPGVSIDFLSNTVHGSPEYDTIPNVEQAEGSTGDDVCKDQDGERNVCEGGEGDDRFEAGVAKPVNDAPDPATGQSDTWDGGPGNDTVSYEQTEHHSPGVSIDFLSNAVHGSPEYDAIPGVENAEGSTGDDVCIDQDGERNSCSLGEGDDTVIAGVAKPVDDAPDENGQSDSWDGGSGNNTLSYEQTEHHSPGVSIDQLLGQVHGSPQYDAFSNFCNFIGSTGDDELITGDVCKTTFVAGIGDDAVTMVGQGTDGSEYRMGDGVDKLDTTGMTVDEIDVNMPADTVTAAGQSDIFDGEDFTAPASAAVVNVVADDNANVLQGGGGHDTLNAAGGNDTVRGGAGDDVIDCGTGTDTVSWSDSPVPVTITMSSTVPGSGTATGYGNDTFVNCEIIQGSSNNDTMVGGDGNDTMYGGAGDDTISGNNGSDTLYGEAGNDRIDGGNNDDVIYGGDGDDLGDGGNSNDTLYGGAGNDELHGGANGSDTAYGEAGDDRIFGDNGPDTLDGGEGNDLVDGGEGPDRCSAGESRANCEF